MGQTPELIESYSSYSSAFQPSESINSIGNLDPFLMEPFIIYESPPPVSKSTKNNLHLSLQRVLADTWRDVVKDLRSVRWGRGGYWFLFFLWSSCLISALVLIPLTITHTSITGDSQSACLPDGSFSLTGDYNPWKLNGFFQITAGFGTLSFTQAKVIDVIWDVVSQQTIAYNPFYIPTTILKDGYNFRQLAALVK